MRSYEYSKGDLILMRIGFFVMILSFLSIGLNAWVQEPVYKRIEEVTSVIGRLSQKNKEIKKYQEFIIMRLNLISEVNENYVRRAIQNPLGSVFAVCDTDDMAHKR